MPETTVDIAALYAALDRKRSTKKLSWRSLAAQLQITPSTFTRMAQGLKPDVDTFATLIRWLGMSQEEFLHPTKRNPENIDPMAMISTYLRGAKNISDEQAAAMEDIMSAAFRHLSKERK